MSLSSKPAAGCVLCFDDEAALASQAAGALGMTTDGRPSKKQRRQIEHFRGAQEQ